MARDDDVLPGLRGACPQTGAGADLGINLGRWVSAVVDLGDSVTLGSAASPTKSNAGGRQAKAEASFAHSKRCREVRLLLQTVRLRPGPRCHDARSVWSARSLLPLYEETSKTVRQATRSPRFKSTKKSMLPLCHF